MIAMLDLTSCSCLALTFLIEGGHAQWKMVFLNTEYCEISAWCCLEFTIMVKFNLEYSVLMNTMVFGEISHCALVVRIVRGAIVQHH